MWRGSDGEHYLNVIELLINDKRCTASMINMKDNTEGMNALMKAVHHRLLLELPGIDCNITVSYTHLTLPTILLV